MQAPGNPTEDVDGSFKYGGWSVNYWDEVMVEFMGEASQHPSDLLLGRRTYEIFASHWPFVQDDPMADILNQANKYVISNSLEKVEWQNSFLIKEDVLAELGALKKSDGIDLQVHGSSQLVHSLFQHGLVDQFTIWTFPLLLGKGKRLFDGQAMPNNLKLINHRVSKSGVIIATYKPNGDISIGSFALDENR